ERLATTTDPHEIHRALTSEAEAPPARAPAPPGAVMSRTVRIANPSGLHARPAAQIVERTLEFDAAVRIVAGEREANAISITPETCSPQIPERSGRKSASSTRREGSSRRPTCRARNERRCGHDRLRPVPPHARPGALEGPRLERLREGHRQGRPRRATGVGRS